MKKHIYYFLIILITVISLPLRATDINGASETISTQEVQVVDINKADIDTLVLLKGIGKSKGIFTLHRRKFYQAIASYWA